MKRWMLIATMGLAAGPAAAHEIEGHRLTLVVQGERHVQATWQLDWPQLLCAPDAEPAARAECLLRSAAEPPEALAPRLARVKVLLEQQWRLTTPQGQRLVLSRWRWPSEAQLHRLLQQRVAQQLVGDHGHDDDPLPVRAEALAPSAMDRLHIVLPAPLQKALVVSYRPQQRWVPAGSSQAIRF